MSNIRVCRWLELEGSTSQQRQVDSIFFETAGTKVFADDTQKNKFYERWIGRYLSHDPQWFYVLVSDDGSVAGYLAGCIDNPAETQRFADLPYYASNADLMARYPAHLHVNLSEPYRGKGLGSKLIDAFASDARAAGAPGVHVVTGSTMRNVSFYLRNGFQKVGETIFNEHPVLFLGRELQ